MKVIPARNASWPGTQSRLLTTASPEFSAGSSAIDPTTASTTWAAANDPVAYPFRLSEAVIVKKLGWVNGSAAGGGVDCGIYSTAWARLVSTGAQTGSGNSLWQWIDVTDTPLPPGKYYLAHSRDNITGNRAMRWGNGYPATHLALLGAQDSTTDAYPLPDPLTNMGPDAAAAHFCLGIQLQPTAVLF